MTTRKPLAEDLSLLATAFFSAIERADFAAVRELYAADVAIWHNVTDREQTRDENLELLRLFTSRVSELRYEVLAREFFPGGFVQRHILHGCVASGESIRAPVCLVVHASDGRIQRLFEYLDPNGVAAAFERPSP
jgi:ketosteroid isomerase-like protein